MLILEGCTSLVEVHESIGYLEKLVLLNLQGCENLKNLPESISNLESLEILNLPHCIKIDKLPTQLGNMVALTHLILKGCTSLVEVHDSIGQLEKLVSLDLQGCENLRNLPESISNLYSLQIFNLSNCIKIDKLPKQLGNMVALTCLHFNRTAIEQLSYSFSFLKKLKCASSSGCKGQSSESLTNPSDYNLFGDGILMDLESLYSLEELNLSSNNFLSLPYCIGRLPKLERLVLDECTSLRSISELPASLGYLSARGCSSLQRLPNVPNQERLRIEFFLDRCDSLAYDFRKSLPQVHTLSLSLSFSHFMM